MLGNRPRVCRPARISRALHSCVPLLLLARLLTARLLAETTLGSRFWNEEKAFGLTPDQEFFFGFITTFLSNVKIQNPKIYKSLRLTMP
jgi:hypothetical protein